MKIINSKLNDNNCMPVEDKVLAGNRAAFQSSELINPIKTYSIIQLDSTGKIITWTDSTETANGLDALELKGKAFKVLFNEQDQNDGLPEILLRRAAFYKMAKSQSWIINNTGETFWRKLTVTPIFDKYAIKGYSIGIVDHNASAQAEKVALELMHLSLSKDSDTISSLKYAKEIQEAILPSEDEILRNVADTFIFCQPKDIISGIFYWYGEVSKYETGVPRHSYKVIVVVDATGQGVPGAMSMVMLNNLLNKIIHEKDIIKPDEILRELDRMVLETVQRNNQYEVSKDGMGISIIVIDEELQKLTFAGAKNPLSYVHNNQLNSIKGSPFPIGNICNRNKKEVKSHSFDIQTNDVFYLVSDRFQDQFGGEKHKAYTTKKLRVLLHSISKLNMNKQKKILSSALKSWMRYEQQAHDILVLGMKF